MADETEQPAPASEPPVEPPPQVASTTTTATTVTTAPIQSQKLTLLGLLDRFVDKGQPFALPEGTIRGTVFLVVTYALMVSYRGPDHWAPPQLEAAFQVMLGFYFGSRQSPQSTATTTTAAATK